MLPFWDLIGSTFFRQNQYLPLRCASSQALAAGTGSRFPHRTIASTALEEVISGSRLVLGSLCGSPSSSTRRRRDGGVSSARWWIFFHEHERHALGWQRAAGLWNGGRRHQQTTHRYADQRLYLLCNHFQ